MQCPQCRVENRNTAKFCEECGSRLVHACPGCGAEVNPRAKFCPECGTRLVEAALSPSPHQADHPRTQLSEPAVSIALPPAHRQAAEAERRQLTVLFCDLVDSTALAGQLDLEEWREVVRAYQAVCAEVIARYEGHIAQYLGDGLLVYFGYPHAHEDDAQRAVRTGLEMVAAIGQLNVQFQQNIGVQLAIRVGIHTGLVVVGSIGGNGRQEALALGDTPHIAARLQGLAEPNAVVISAVTQQLVEGYFACQDGGLQSLKGVPTPLTIYRALAAYGVQGRIEAARPHGLTPFVGREAELTQLLELWRHVQEGKGQVVVLTGEAGIGKSRLLETFTARLQDAAYIRLTFRCSPYALQSVLYPVIEHLQRSFSWTSTEPPESRLDTLARLAQINGWPVAEAVPLLAILLAVPLPKDRYSPLSWTPQRQKEETFALLSRWLLRDAERRPVLAIWEDLHWADPSTLEFLSHLVAQAPTARILLILSGRPDFRPPWLPDSSLTRMVLNRLTPPQVERMLQQLTGGKLLPSALVRQMVTKADGVPLFVEELTKMMLEAGGLREQEDHYELAGTSPQLAIPATLHDLLMSRLDRLGAAKEVAQLGATLGREFPYELLQAIATIDEASLRPALAQLVDADLLSQQGIAPQAMYCFKHALIQEAAYQSLLKRTRQQAHRRIAQVLARQFPQDVEVQPELLAHHYTEAGLHQQAVVYWQRAGQRALQASACAEAIAHLRMGIKLLRMLPDVAERSRQEITLQITLGRALMAIKGYAAPEVVQAYTQARELCRQVGAAPQLFESLMGLCVFYQGRAEFETARELGEQLLCLAEDGRDPTLLVWAHNAMGYILHLMGELALARTHLERSLAIYDPKQHRAYGFVFDPGVDGLCMSAQVLQMLGYPDRAMQKSLEALALARELTHPFSLVIALRETASVYRRRGEQELAETLQEEGLRLCHEQGFAQELAQGMVMHGPDLVRQGKGEAGITQMHQGLAALRATGTEAELPWLLSMLATACGNVGKVEEGLNLIDEAVEMVHRTGKHLDEAGVYRVKGELLLKARGLSLPSAGPTTESEAEACFRQALNTARRQQAKSLELRAAMSLSRLWQRQGKRAEARELLTEIYGWFTEGFDTADLQEARKLLETLS